MPSTDSSPASTPSHAMEPPPTLEGLVKEVCISLHLLDQKCSDEHLKSISLFLDWRSVAPHLGLSERDIEDVEVEKKTEPERRLKVLQKWKRKYGYMATFRKLVEVLLVVVGNADDAERVCRLLQTPTDTGMTTEVCICTCIIVFFCFFNEAVVAFMKLNSFCVYAYS